MATWLQHIQNERKVARSVSKLGWIEERDGDKIKVKGFTAGDCAYGPDGKKEASLRIAAEYKEIARHYLPAGNLEEWRAAADFLCDQDNPAFTAILASAFSTPLFGFTGMPGAVMSIVSTKSGLGKTSAMKAAQAVWGSPTKAMNSTSDTYLSIIRKASFIKNLPVYWDEVRGEHALEAFSKTAYDIAQGKERTRLNTNADMREVNDFRTMVIGASNESIFDYMGAGGGQSNAGAARVFEVEVDPFEDPSRASRNALFGMLDNNYGVAGQLYAEYMARNQPALAKAVFSTYERLYSEWGFSEGERFWCAIVASLLVGAQAAKKAGLCNINQKTLAGYLKNRVAVLRVHSEGLLSASSAREIVIAYLQAHQDNQLTLDEWPKPGAKAQMPNVVAPPKNKLMIVRVGDTYRMVKSDFNRWLKTSMRTTFKSIETDLRRNLKYSEFQTKLGSQTRWELPKGRVFEVDLS